MKGNTQMLYSWRIQQRTHGSQWSLASCHITEVLSSLGVRNYITGNGLEDIWSSPWHQALQCVAMTFAEILTGLMYINECGPRSDTLTPSNMEQEPPIVRCETVPAHKIECWRYRSCIMFLVTVTRRNNQVSHPSTHIDFHVTTWSPCIFSREIFVL